MTKHFPDDIAVAGIGLSLLDCSLPKQDWTHAGHFAAALWFLRCRPELSAADDMPAIIRAYNTATGVANTDTGGYHETITQASLRAARAFLGGYPEWRPLHEAVDQLLETPLGDPNWLLEFWTRERLFSIAARRHWVEPDRRALPY